MRVRINAHFGRMLAFLCCVTAVSRHLQAQTQDFDEPTAAAHSTTRAEPIYPAIAKAAHVQGDVILSIVVAIDGQVKSVKVLSGPPMLQQAAIDAVKGWRYKPFERDGTPVEAAVKVTLPFYLGKVDPNDEQIAREYFPLSDKCHEMLRQPAGGDSAVSPCLQAAQKAEQFSTTERFIERRSAYVYCASAYLRTNRAKEAVPWAAKAVAVVSQGHDDLSGSSAAYSVLGQAQGLSGDLAGADENLARSEDMERRALDTPAGKSLAVEYKRALKNILLFRAQVLIAMNKPGDAQKLQQEAGEL